MEPRRTVSGAGPDPGGRRCFPAVLLAWLAVGLAAGPVLAGGDVERRGGAGRGGGGEAGEDGGGSRSGGRTWGDLETPAGLTLRLESGDDDEGPGRGAAVRAVLHNGGTEPVTVALDPRLADLELRAGRTRVRCASPQDMSPPGLHGAETVTLEEGADAEVRLDLLYHCWDRLDRVRRAAGENPAELGVTYRLVLVDPELGEAVGRAGRLEAQTTVRLGPTDAAEPEDAGGGDDEPLRVEARKADVADGDEVWLSVAVRNRTDESLKLVDHPTQFRFEVTGPTGTWTCAMDPWRITPLADLLVRLRRGGKYERRLELTRYCPAEALVEPGVYWVAPIYDPYLADRAPEPVLDREVRGRPAPVRVRQGGDR
ncbi:MAG: hypothetical protein JXB32_00150 [Deltaproteobacteria bacterium]|nr:hypothetical protein [Deltaproteobacteria bacterium]